METARPAFPVLRPSRCRRVTVHAGRYEGPAESAASGGGGAGKENFNLPQLRVSDELSSIRSTGPVDPVLSRSSPIGVYASRQEEFMLSSSGMRESSVIRPTKPLINNETETPDLQFDALQPSDRDLSPALRRDFSQYTARVALIDLELWAAAWLRAETHYENQSDLRYVERFRMQYAHQQFKEMKKWFARKHYAQKCFCLVTVKNDEKNGKRSALQSVVGTLDVHVRHPIHGELYPGEGVNKPGICDIYRTNQPQIGYIADVCVSKHARRQGIGRNMIFLAINISFSHGVQKIFIHVHKENYAAQNLYRQMGFKVVERDCSLKPSDNILLSLCSPV